MTVEAVGRATTGAAAAPRTLLGGYFRVESTREWVRMRCAALILFGPARLVLTVAALLPEPGLCRAVERWWARLAARLVGLRIDVSGLEHIEPGERYVVASLHEGFADGLALLHLPMSLTAVARDELATFPLLGAQLARGRHLLVSPERPLQGARTLHREARGAIEEGDSILLFPQGSILGIELAFQPGAFHLARRLGRPLLPVVVTGGHRVWEHPFTPTLRANQTMSLAVLPPVPPEEAVAREPAIEREMKRVALASKTPPRHFDPGRDGYWDGYRYEIDPAFPDLARRVASHRREGVDGHAHQS
ncbi:MAG: 1-acyl-sn-glycerol-3-phosphate acyltransferase [Dehalococcoidia bacterium]|nr:1-acyl-sn-glycerol-3-phosphate acyltransferase [Dehalococcoidia bacterium]MYD27483.1 1-acyl-sn-glycerol-3-phosphate acyltransferase [Dehalococcoidia bacterium]